MGTVGNNVSEGPSNEPGEYSRSYLRALSERTRLFCLVWLFLSDGGVEDDSELSRTYDLGRNQPHQTTTNFLRRCCDVKIILVRCKDDTVHTHGNGQKTL